MTMHSSAGWSAFRRITKSGVAKERREKESNKISQQTSYPPEPSQPLSRQVSPTSGTPSQNACT